MSSILNEWGSGSGGGAAVGRVAAAAVGAAEQPSSGRSCMPA